MPEELQTQQDLTENLLSRLRDPREDVREAAAEALEVSTRDEDWRPDDPMLDEGIDILMNLLGEGNLHLVRSALAVIIAIADAGHEEDLITRGIIGRLDRMGDHRDPGIREMVREALWVLTPDVEDVVTRKPQDEY